MVLVKLFLTFFKIGIFSFGGGYAMLPFIQQEVIKNHHWLTSKEFIDVLAISQITPGPIAINSATFIGYRVAQVPGAIAATLAVVLPSFIIILTIISFIEKFKDTPAMKSVFSFLRPVVIGLIASAALLVAKDTFVDIKGPIIGLVIFFLLTWKKVNPILGIVFSGILGVILY